MNREQIAKWAREAKRHADNTVGSLPLPGNYEPARMQILIEQWESIYNKHFARLVRKAALDEAITLCNNEANMRWVREKNPLPGDNPTAQGHKAVTARGLACSIAALAAKETK